MIPYSLKPNQLIKTPFGEIAEFNSEGQGNIDQSTVDAFGEEWSKFSSFSEAEIKSIGDEYFDIVPEQAYGADKVALDLGCGSGRWSLYAAEKFKFIEAIDPSQAALVAQKQSQGKNIRISKAGVDEIPFADESFDFVFSLGVLHHIPNTKAALKSLSRKLKSKGYLLLYLYYALDNRGYFYKLIFKLSNMLRLMISKLPSSLKRFFCDLIALIIYLPFIALATFFKLLGATSISRKIPLHYYLGKSWQVIRNDALDRFGTPLEQRFSKAEIEKMLIECGFTEIQFSPNMPYWHAIAKKQ